MADKTLGSGMETEMSAAGMTPATDVESAQIASPCTSGVPLIEDNRGCCIRCGASDRDKCLLDSAPRALAPTQS